MDGFRDTIITVKEHFEVRFNELEKRIILTQNDLERRLEGMNEFREQLHNQANTFLTRERFDVESQRINDKITDLQLWRADHQGRQARTSVISIIAILVSVGLAILQIIK